jgi:hypothetical protein
MTNKSISNQALSIIDQYQHFAFGNAVCRIPYFNNKSVRARAAMRANIGKGSPKDILEEIETIALKTHINKQNLSDEALKKLLTDNNIGIECSGFAYYILDAESESRGKSSLKKHLNFINCKGLTGKLRCSLRPIENCDVQTLANDKNSKAIEIKNVNPGDMITMLGDGNGDDRDHVMVITQVEFEKEFPKIIHYAHSIAYPEDGLYGTGIRQGQIKINNTNTNIISATWIEDGKENANNLLFKRAQKSKTEIRRLNWF